MSNPNDENELTISPCIKWIRGSSISRVVWMTSNEQLTLQYLAVGLTVSLDLYAVWSKRAQKNIGCCAVVRQISADRYEAQLTWASSQRQTELWTAAKLKDTIPRAYQVSIVDDTGFKHAFGRSYANCRPYDRNGDLFAAAPLKGSCARPVRDQNVFWGTTTAPYWYEF